MKQISVKPIHHGPEWPKLVRWVSSAWKLCPTHEQLQSSGRFVSLRHYSNPPTTDCR